MVDFDVFSVNAVRHFVKNDFLNDLNNLIFLAKMQKIYLPLRHEQSSCDCSLTKIPSSTSSNGILEWCLLREKNMVFINSI